VWHHRIRLRFSNKCDRYHGRYILGKDEIGLSHLELMSLVASEEKDFMKV
jgi:hypothetical protein